MMNQMKHALFFVIGAIFGSSIVLMILVHPVFLYIPALISIAILASVTSFFINNWNE